MADPIDELIKEIAGKHGVAVGRDDPIMILQTINARLLEDSAKAQQAMLALYKEELEALSARWSSDAKEKGERNGRLIRAEIETAADRVAVSLRQRRMAGILNMVASCITLLAVATAVWAVMH